MWDNARSVRRTLVWLYVAVLLMLVSAAFVWLYHSPYFPIRRIDINGKLIRSDRRQLQRLAQEHIQGSILKADLNIAQEAFSRQPWIAKAEVRRRLPDVVEIILVEREPVARWSDGRLLDSEGNLFSAELDDESKLPVFEGLDDTGKIMISRWRYFQAGLTPLGLKVKKLTCTARAAWTLELNNGLVIRLGREKEEERFKRFVTAWPLELRSRAESLDYVDMRYSDGFAVRMKDTAKPSENTE